jgi:RNA polymerase sigma factor for flagellar operon FliA
MVAAHLDLPRRVALRIRRTLPRGLDFDDLVQAGHIGLLKAARDYEPAKGKGFPAYAWLRIAGAIRDSVRADGLHKRTRPGVERVMFRLESTLTPESDGEPNAFLEHLPTSAPAGRLEGILAGEDLAAAVEPLTLRERVTLILVEGHGFTLREAGIVVGVSESRACQILKGAWRKVRERS